MPVLATSAQRTSTTVLLSEAAVRRGLRVVTVTGSQKADELVGGTVHWYGGPLAADRIAGRLGIALLEPADGWLAALPEAWVGRTVELITLSEARSARRPVFVKPPSGKSFPAAVYPDGSRLPGHRDDLRPDTPVLISEVVTFAVEYRLFVLDGAVAAGSRYALYGRLDVAPLTGDAREREVRAFAAGLLDAVADTLPSAVTLDVGLIRDPDTGWSGGRSWRRTCRASRTVTPPNGRGTHGGAARGRSTRRRDGARYPLPETARRRVRRARRAARRSGAAR